jgi:hypothetical protein
MVTKLAQKSSHYSAGRSILIIGLLALAAVGLFLVFKPKDNTIQLVRREENISPEEQPATAPLPETKQLVVPFTPQAPTANWDELHNEACEEASVIMAWAYFNGITSLPASRVEAEISKLTDWQTENYGYYLSITTEETVRMAREVYGLKTEVVPLSEAVVKRALADGKLVIWPGQGQLLGNPNFTPPGPPYHMLVLTGYNASQFITNDPGTRRGKDYPYSYATLEAAAGSYSHAAHEVNTSEKFVILVSK